MKPMTVRDIYGVEPSWWAERLRHIDRQRRSGKLCALSGTRAWSWPLLTNTEFRWFLVRRLIDALAGRPPQRTLWPVRRG